MKNQKASSIHILWQICEEGRKGRVGRPFVHKPTQRALFLASIKELPLNEKISESQRLWER